MKNAANVEQAHEFAKWLSEPEGSAALGDRLLGQPGGQGRDRPDGSGCRRILQLGTFNDDALTKLWWWPDQEAWFIAKRGEYADKFKAA